MSQKKRGLAMSILVTDSIESNDVVEVMSTSKFLKTITGDETEKPHQRIFLDISSLTGVDETSEGGNLLSLLMAGNVAAADPLDTLISDQWYGIVVRHRTYSWEAFGDAASKEDFSIPTNRLFVDVRSIPSGAEYQKLQESMGGKGVRIVPVHVLGPRGEVLELDDAALPVE